MSKPHLASDDFPCPRFPAGPFQYFEIPKWNLLKGVARPSYCVPFPPNLSQTPSLLDKLNKLHTLDVSSTNHLLAAQMLLTKQAYKGARIFASTQGGRLQGSSMGMSAVSPLNLLKRRKT